MVSGLQRSSVLSGRSLYPLCPRAVSSTVRHCSATPVSSYQHRCTVVRCSSACPHGLQVMITLSAHTSCSRIGNVQACLGNTRVSLYAVAAKPSFISTAHGSRRPMGHVPAPESTTEAGVVQSRRMHVSAESFLISKVGSGAEGRVAAPDPSRMARRVRSSWAHGSAGALLGGGEGSGALDTWQRRSPPLSREACSGTAVARGNVWMHTLSFVLA
jgi:hypothetical protein